VAHFPNALTVQHTFFLLCSAGINSQLNSNDPETNAGAEMIRSSRQAMGNRLLTLMKLNVNRVVSGGGFRASFPRRFLFRARGRKSTRGYFRQQQ